jgi:hypothetical protein
MLGAEIAQHMQLHATCQLCSDARRCLCAVYTLAACCEPGLHAGLGAMHLMCTFKT